MAVGAARRHHRRLDTVDELVEVVELLLERDLVVAILVECVGHALDLRTFNAATASATAGACSSGLTFSKTCAMRPFASMMKVVRLTPQYFRPYIDFSAQTPYASATLCSSSASNGYVSSFFFLNFWCDLTESGLMPSTTASSPSNRGRASRNEHAS